MAANPEIQLINQRNRQVRLAEFWRIVSDGPAPRLVRRWAAGRAKKHQDVAEQLDRQWYRPQGDSLLATPIE